MMCENCREHDAVVTLTQIVDSAPTQIHLCEKCAAERGIETSGSVQQHPLGHFLQAVQKMPALPSSSARCAFCQSTLRDFQVSGRLGCARCYTSFEPTIRDLLRRVHGNSRHVGKEYEAPTVTQDEGASMLGELRQRLRRAIEAEQFELAAKLRDQIKVLE
jgi:protein arginine kinase activator